MDCRDTHAEVQPTLALGAGEAGDVGLDDDRFADPLGRNPGSDALDRAEDLVTHDPGILRGLPSAAEHAQVRSAETDAADGDLDVIRSNLWLRDVVDHDLPGTDEQSGLHAPPPADAADSR